MNENQEKNPSGKKSRFKLPVKKTARASALIYLALAITVVIVATVGIFSMSYDYDAELEPVSFPDLNLSDVSMPDVSMPDLDVSIPDNAPVINEESNVTDDVTDSKPQELPKPTPQYYRPVNGEVVKKYSMDKLVFSQTMQDYRVHSGIDIKGEIGDRVVCYTEGTVLEVKNDYFYGTTVSVGHADGSVTFYMNLSEDLPEGITAGAEIKAGQALGYIGETARCEKNEEPHVHFEITKNGKLTDPISFLP